MKKILFLLPSLATGGLERVQVTLANALAKSGHDVTVMALDPADDLRSDLDARVHYRHKPYKAHPIGSRLPYIRHKLYDDGMWETRASAKTLYEYYVGSEQFDVEIAFFRGLPIKIISGSTNQSSVKLAWVHSDFRLARGYKNNFVSLDAVRTAYASFDKIVCISEEAKRGFVETIGNTKNLAVIYDPLPIERIRSLGEEALATPTKKAAFHLVLVARLLDDTKGQCRLISVVKRLRDEGFDLSLSFVGGGPDEEKIRQAIEGAGLADFVTLTGSQKNPYPYIKEADLLVCASYFEGYNLTVAEALILGVPVLSTRCAGPVEILDSGKYGRIAENTDESLYENLKDLLCHPEELAVYRSLAKERIAFFDDAETAKKVETIFER